MRAVLVGSIVLVALVGVVPAPTWAAPASNGGAGPDGHYNVHPNEVFLWKRFHVQDSDTVTVLRTVFGTWTVRGRQTLETCRQLLASVATP